MVTNSEPQHNRPQPGQDWRAVLHARGLPDTTIDYYGIVGNQRLWGKYVGWLYPIDTTGELCRFKNVNGHGPKYAYVESEPPHTFYDVRGKLAYHVGRAGGVLILCAGEPDVWTLHAAGLYNMTCTLAGEGSLPKWFTEAIIALAPSEVRIYPDRDKAGVRFAQNIVTALRDTGIAVKVYELPGKMGSKYDLNRLWQDCAFDRERFMAALEACPPLVIEAVETEPQRPRKIITSNNFSGAWLDYGAYIREHARAAWQFGAKNGNGHSPNINCPNPAHEDQHASASWCYEGRDGGRDYLHCHGCGGMERDDIAAQLGLLTFDEWRAEQGNPLTVNIHSDTPAPEMSKILDTDPTIPHTIATRLIDAKLHNALLVWANGLQPDGLTRRTYASGIEQLRDTLQIINEPIYVQNGTLLVLGEQVPFQNVQNSARGRPARQWALMPRDQMLDRLEAFFSGHARAKRYHDTPSDVQADFADPPLDDAQVSNLNAKRLKNYALHEEKRAKAARALERDLDYIRQDFERIRQDRYTVFDMPEGVSNARALKQALYERTLDDNPEGVESYKLRHKAGISRATQSRYRKQYNTIAIPQHVDIEIVTVDDVLLGQQQTAELIAPDGTTRFIRSDEVDTADTRAFIASHPGVILRKPKPSIEKRAQGDTTTQAERDAYQRYSAQQRLRGAKGAAGGPHAPARRDTHYPTGYTDAWLEKQLQYTPGAGDVPRYDASTGEVFTAPQRWRLLAEARETQEGEAMPFATYSEPREREGLLESSEPSEDGTTSEPPADIVTHNGEQGFYLPSGRFWRLLEPDQETYKQKYEQGALL